MIIQIKNQTPKIDYTIVELTNETTGHVNGLYLIPSYMSIDSFENAIKTKGLEKFQSEMSDLGIEMIFPYEMVVEF